MATIRVSIFSHPPGLIVTKGNEVKVEGWFKGGLLRAETFQGLNPEGPVYRCGAPKASNFMRPEHVIKIGVVKEIRVLEQGISFVMETAE